MNYEELGEHLEGLGFPKMEEDEDEEEDEEAEL
eukprot:CAMPEP_0118920734 /NCGR_PEP_ID=MMETSP1169-20130426/164_1 /TAXON_ID=36882 /ORGANISM="Pyramimonas obovata, Strain CCMP722" /LENGTH=32 /DNA_ID= /DNA_START= /DNA_END= /DNA_ORIENTATION=